MNYHNSNLSQPAKDFCVDITKGLTREQVGINRSKYGANKLTPKKEKTIVKRLIDALLEPMMLILLVAFCLTLGINIGKFLKGTDADFYECIGILIAISISVILTVVMESKSDKAFKMLEKMGSNSAIKVLRSGEVAIVKKEDLVVGDIVFLEAGNEVPADGRIITSTDLLVQESLLTGESVAVAKDEKAKLSENTPLAERKNMVFSGTFVERGECKFLVTAVGNNAETGKIADKVVDENKISAPLNDKLSRLGKMVTKFGVISSLFVFLLSIIRLALISAITFDNIQEAFIQSIVLIVAAVPEGLPTTVAISLTLNVLRLAKSNALIRKLVATETIGCVSVICSDKTGTLTKNQMSLEKVVTLSDTFTPSKIKNQNVLYNIAVNSTADLIDNRGKISCFGSPTETALLEGVVKSGYDYKKIRKSGAISLLTPFSSQIKYMETEFTCGDFRRIYIKGAPEVVLEKCLLSEKQRLTILEKISEEQKAGGRVIAFASTNNGSYIYDGYAVIKDGLRDDVKEAVFNCQKAGIAVKMLTGDNVDTAKSIAKSAGLSVENHSVVSADSIEKMSDEELEARIPFITVIARSTPQTKLRVVKALQKRGEIVAVTGDGVNDAPAIKHADVGIAMGSGSEITKQASDVVLLDNSFSTILKAISFGRNVYCNFQRFITFQLTVNLSSICIILASLLSGFLSPFSSTCLLWLNVIMDGPLALSLGLENRNVEYLTRKPVKRDSDILSGKILVKIGLHSLFTCVIVTLQRYFNFLDVKPEEQAGVIITAFVFFQVFNAVNCRELTSTSSFKGLAKNKLLLIMISVTYLLQVFIMTCFPEFFGVKSLEWKTILKLTALCFSIIVFSEGYKFLYRKFKKIGLFGKKRKIFFNPKIPINEKAGGYAQYE